MHIKVKRGLDVPMAGVPEGAVKTLIPSGQTSEHHESGEFSLNLRPFKRLRFKLLKKVGDQVKIGEPVVEDKGCPGRFFVSPAGGVIKDVRRGLRRAIIDIIVKADVVEEKIAHKPLDPKSASSKEMIAFLMKGGLFERIFQRPFCLLADPAAKPRSIFVKAIESAPYTPSAEMQVAGYEKAFQEGLDALVAIADGSPVHLVYRSGSSCRAFTEAKGVVKHTAEGPHPVANSSLHIQKIDPIGRAEDVVWAIAARDVVAIGVMVLKGYYHNEKVISIAGNGLIPRQAGYFRVREGTPVAALIAGRIPREPLRFISGDPLMGDGVDMNDFLGYYDTVFCAIPESVDREFLHFFRLGINKYSFSHAYVSGHFKPGRLYDFTTSQHGEHRAFIDSSMYDKVMPLEVPTMQLVKAVMAEDYDLAEQLGLMEVAPEDFALPAFVCPSKMEMVEIMRDGLVAHAAEMLE